MQELARSTNCYYYSCRAALRQRAKGNPTNIPQQRDNLRVIYKNYLLCLSRTVRNGEKIVREKKFPKILYFQ